MQKKRAKRIYKSERGNVIIHRPDEICATEISPRWNGIKRFHWAGWAGRDAKDAKVNFLLLSVDPLKTPASAAPLSGVGLLAKNVTLQNPDTIVVAIPADSAKQRSAYPSWPVRSRGAFLCPAQTAREERRNS